MAPQEGIDCWPAKPHAGPLHRLQLFPFLCDGPRQLALRDFTLRQRF
jgi:hypothetical protein